MQHSQTKEIETEEAPKAELEGGVDDEARYMGYELDDGIPAHPFQLLNAGYMATTAPTLPTYLQTPVEQTLCLSLSHGPIGSLLLLIY